MKAETARLLRAVLRLVETDVLELADAVVEIDEREAAHHAEVADLDRRISLLSATVTDHLVMHVDSIEHSGRVPS